jgi:hypothetical protein
MRSTSGCVTRGQHVRVLGAAPGKQIGEIPNTAGVHGVAFARDLKLGFTGNQRDNRVTTVRC